MNRRTVKPTRRTGAALAIAIASILGDAALAADTTTTLEEIIVTAERREQSLQDIPVSATVLTGETLAKQGVDNIIEIQQVAPSVAINTYNRGTFINIRGVGIAQSAPTSVPGVATYIDGVYIAHETFIAHSFYDIASIEVLRGPQGTLTGQNSTGGAIYMRTPDPDVNAFSGYVEGNGGNYEYYRTSAALNIPMGGVVGLRLSGVYDHRGSFTENVGPSPSEPGSSELTGARAALRIQPAETLTLDLRYEYFDLESDYNAIKNRIDFVTTDPFKIDENAISYLNQDGYRASLEGRWNITSEIQLRAITSRLDADNIDQADGDRRSTLSDPLPNPPTTGVARVGFTSQSFDTKVTEVNLLSTGERKFNWVFGGFYMTETTPVQVFRDQSSNGGNPITFVTPVATSRIIAEAANKSVSGFGQLDIRFTDALELDVGARYSKDTQDYTRYALPGPPPAGCFPCSNRAESDEVTGRVATKYHVSDDSMVYASVSRGYKAGGVNLDPRLGIFEPETNTVGEVGIKTGVADGRLRINGDVFYSKYKGIQLSALTSIPGVPGPPVPNTLNGEAKSYGAELEFTGQFDKLGMNLGIAYLRATFDGNQLFTNPETNQNELVPDGRVLPFAPKYTVTGGIEYEFAMGDMRLTPRLQASFIDEQYSTPYPNAVVAPTTISSTRVPSRVVSDFRATLSVSESLQLEGFVTNLFDKTYIAVQVQNASSAAGGYIYGAPRQYGGRIVYKF